MLLVGFFLATGFFAAVVVAFLTAVEPVDEGFDEVVDFFTLLEELPGTGGGV